MDRKKKILAFVYNDYGRDIEQLLPVVYFAEKHLNAIVEFAFVYDIYAIYRKKPDLVLLPNSSGSNLYFYLSKYAHSQGIKVFSLISEGNFRIDGSFNFWGYNTDKKFYEDFFCYWSERTKNFMESQLPEYKKKMVLTGASGFDRYKIYKFISKEEFLKKKGLSKFNKIISYAGWSFGRLNNSFEREVIKRMNPNEDRLKWMEEQMHLVSSILKKAVEKNPDILFIFKQHPNEVYPSIVQDPINEMIKLKSKQNVLYIKNGEDIHDLINISDIWMGFETTTTLEAWLLKQMDTILINPDPDFKRQRIYEGSVIVNNSEELQNSIDEYYEKGHINAFQKKEKSEIRNFLIKDIIGFDDGLNHLRAGYYLKETLNKTDQNKRRFIISLKYLKMYVLMNIGKYFYIKSIFSKLPKFKKTVWIFDNHNLKGITNLKEKYYKFLDEFYKQKKLDEKIQNNTLWKKIISKKS